jgi:hypothetical protein
MIRERASVLRYTYIVCVVLRNEEMRLFVRVVCGCLDQAGSWTAEVKTRWSRFIGAESHVEVDSGT